jgi:hypothetical protein
VEREGRRRGGDERGRTSRRIGLIPSMDLTRVRRR